MLTLTEGMGRKVHRKFASKRPTPVIDIANDEIENYSALAKSIMDAAGQATKTGFKAVERFGCDCEEPGIEEGLQEILKGLAAAPDTDRFALTGAWFDPARETGCASAVEKLLLEQGFECLVLESAAILPDEEDNEA